MFVVWVHWKTISFKVYIEVYDIGDYSETSELESTEIFYVGASDCPSLECLQMCNEYDGFVDKNLGFPL